MNVYVASSFHNKPAVREMIARLRVAGHTITHDWTPADPGDRTGEELVRYCTENAIEDIEKGVRPAQVVVVLHDDRGRGMLAEFGAGLYGDKRLIVVNPPADPMAQVFYNHPCVTRVETQQDAVLLINVWQQEVDQLLATAKAAGTFTLEGEEVTGTINALLDFLSQNQRELLAQGLPEVKTITINAVALLAIFERTLKDIHPESIQRALRAFGVELSKYIAVKPEFPTPLAEA